MNGSKCVNCSCYWKICCFASKMRKRRDSGLTDSRMLFGELHDRLRRELIAASLARDLLYVLNAFAICRVVSDTLDRRAQRGDGHQLASQTCQLIDLFQVGSAWPHNHFVCSSVGIGLNIALDCLERSGKTIDHPFHHWPHESIVVAEVGSSTLFCIWPEGI